MSKRLYKKDGSGPIGDVEIDYEIERFVRNILKTYSKYNEAELELYIVEGIMSEFISARILKRAEQLREKEKREE